jgi:hypothetical protein
MLHLLPSRAEVVLGGVVVGLRFVSLRRVGLLVAKQVEMTLGLLHRFRAGRRYNDTVGHIHYRFIFAQALSA